MAGQGKWVMARGCCCPRPPNNAEDAACIFSSIRINSICISICISICMNCICISICMNCICSTICIICICIACIYIHFCIFLSYRRLQPRAWDASLHRHLRCKLSLSQKAFLCRSWRVCWLEDSPSVKLLVPACYCFLCQEVILKLFSLDLCVISFLIGCRVF